VTASPGAIHASAGQPYAASSDPLLTGPEGRTCTEPSETRIEGVKRAQVLNPFGLAQECPPRHVAHMAAPQRSRLARSRQEQVDALGHIGYEVWMAASAASQLRSPPDPTMTTERTNALIESGLVHARNLTEFFVPSKGTTRKADDMIPADFASAWTPEPVKAVQYLRTHRRVLNIDMTHLSWGRVTTARRLQRPDTVEVMRSAVLVAFAWRDYLWTAAPELAKAPSFSFYMVGAKNALDNTRTGANSGSVAVTTSTSGPTDVSVIGLRPDGPPTGP